MNHYSNSHNADSKERLELLKDSFICPICRDKLHFDTSLILCDSCSTKFPQISEDWINLFPNALLEHEEQWASRQKDMEGWYQDLLSSPAKASASLLSDYTPFATTLNSLIGKVLDIGGGVGLVRHYLSSNTQYTVLDPSLDWLGVEWTNLSDVFPCLATYPSFVRGVGEYVPFPDNYFDVVLSFWSANHSNNPQKLFEEAERVLRPGGKFFIVLEDMVPLWRDILDKGFPSEEVFESFFGSQEKPLGYARFRLLLHLVLGYDFPLQNDHIRIQEADIYRWIENKFQIIQRIWVNQFLTFEFKKNGLSCNDNHSLKLEISQEKPLQFRDASSHLKIDKVSVIIPCYKQAHYLGEAIESVLAQSYSNYEIIVVDDGSPDNTAEVAARYLVRYIRQENQGLSGARNTGWQASTGKYLVFLDADDRLTCDALRAGLNCFHAYPDCAFVSGHHRYINGDGSLLNEYPPEPIDDDYYIALLKRNYIGMHATVMYQRSVFDVVGGFDTSLKSCEDYDLYLRIAKKFPIYRHPYITAEYRWHDSNMTYNASRMLNAALTVLRSQWLHIQDNPHYISAYCTGVRFWRNYFGQQLLNRVGNAAKSGELNNAIVSSGQLFKYFSLWLSAVLLELRAFVSLLLHQLKLQQQPFDSDEIYQTELKVESSTHSEFVEQSTPNALNSYES